MNRRELFTLAGAGLVSGYAGWSGGRAGPPRRKGTAAVAVMQAESYAVDLAGRILAGVKACGLDVQGKSVLLKPDLAGFDPHNCINTDVAVVLAATEVFQSLGAAQVRIGAGPSYRRDTCALVEAARYRALIPHFDDIFVDLNTDDVSPFEGFAGGGEIYLPNTALRADLVVSLAKMKTDREAGAALSMKNLLGIVPGGVYGWPKDELRRIGVTTSILELTRVFRRSFAIVDGVVGMEGNGPVRGTPKAAGVLVMGGDLLAVDATCCRIMGIDPDGIEYLRQGADQLGVTAEDRIEQVGENPAALGSVFAR